MAQAAHARVGLGTGGMQSFLPHSVAATLGVLAFPSAVLFSLLLLTEPNPPVLLCSAISIVLSSAASVIGARLWQKHPRSNEISFGDLMIWSWWTRKRAEARLQRGTTALGLDRRGTPVADQKLSRQDQLQILHELNAALESKDPYTRGHSGRVERHVFRMANTMGLSVHDIEDLRLAASLHDVGKIRVPDHILRKPTELTRDEYRVMQDHPSVGAWMLSYVGNQNVIEAVRYHHERWDGRGYPDGLSRTDIPLFARMIAVADTFDAVTSTRPYRAKAARNEGLKELEKVSGSQLDPMCVEAFTSSLPEPVPVAALLYLLPFGIKRLIREFGVVARRTGMQTIASGVGAASAAVIVTAPVVAPSLGAKPAAIERTVDSVSDDSGEVAGDDAPELVADDKADAKKKAPNNRKGLSKGKRRGASTARTNAPGIDPLTSLAGGFAGDPTEEELADLSGEEPQSDGTTAPASDSGDSGTDTSGSEEGSGEDADKDADKDKGDRGNNDSDRGSGPGNPGASAGQDGSNGNSGTGEGKGKDKDKDKDDADNGADPEPGEDSGDPGDGGSGNSGDHGNGNGNSGGSPSDEGGNGNSGEHGNGNGNSDGDNGKGKDKDKEAAGTDGADDAD